MMEQQRLQEFTRQEAPPATALFIEVQQVSEPASCLAKLVTIVQGMLSVPVELWREDAAAEWEPYLPDWFVASMKRPTPAQRLALPDQWDYASWVAAICDRQWEW